MLLLVGCGGDGYTPELRAIDTIINEKPDSALRLLDSLSTEAGNSVAKTCNQVSSNYKRGCVNTIGTPPLTIYMICVNATAVVAHNRQNRMVMSDFTLQKYCKNGNLQGGGNLLLGGKSLKMVYQRWRNYAPPRPSPPSRGEALPWRAQQMRGLQTLPIVII